MRMLDIIIKKRDGQPLSPAEIAFAVSGYASGDIPDYQMAPLLMAVYLNGMDAGETYALTDAMLKSGRVADLSAINGVKVDKHSSGGVADTTTLVLAPLVAACGAPVAKLSGRALGHTGGTIDKLESIPGLRTDLTQDAFVDQVNRIGIAVAAATAEAAPADKRIYALRDVTGTVESLPLIASSIMSKKLASGADAIVLDVKTGSGAFMKTREASVALAKAMCDIGARANKRVSAIVSDMNQPLGMAVGNAVEVKEAIDVLKGDVGGDSPLALVSLELGVMMLTAAGVAKTRAEAFTKLQSALSSGRGYEKFEQFVAAQGGDLDALDKIKTKRTVAVMLGGAGYIQSMDAAEIGACAQLLGAGRLVKTDVIDPAVGILMKKRIGEYIGLGEAAAYLYVNGEKNLDEVMARFAAAITLSDSESEEPQLIYERLEAQV